MKASHLFYLSLILLSVVVINCALEEPGERQLYRLRNDLDSRNASNPDVATTHIGIVSVFEDRTFFITDGNDYNVSGNELKPYIGKRVKITGTVTENPESLNIRVTKVEEVE
ncbi:MAG: hypothetical protein PVJ84_11705 [Desulfobacteraceae bacterium]|jgi:hypothetical protein